MKKRILSLLLTLLTVLTLLPTAAFAAESTGTGITPVTNPNLWSTRLTSTGQSYSYRPPTAAGRQLYCMDLGYSYRYGTASFLNSYTYKSATGADADKLWKEAIAKSGLGEMDAITQANVKWMMSYIADYTGEIPGSLFMALQTYIWDNQSDKSAGGDTSGDIDAGGFANADTYDTYVGYYNWLLGQKANEDAELQAQVEEYAAQGVQASIVEDDADKWAVLATSSVSGRQSFFAYHSNRKVVTGDAPGGDDNPPPVAGDGDITFKKVIAGTTRGLDGAVYNIYRDGQIIGSDVTSGGGIIKVNDVTTGLYTFVEREAPEGYALDPTPHSVYVDVTDGNKQYAVSAADAKLPSMKIVKTDAQTGKPVPGAVFSIKSVTGSYSTSVTVGKDGTALLEDLDADVYVVREESVPEPYTVSNTEQTVALQPGKTSEVSFTDYQKPGLEIVKRNIATDGPIAHVTFKIEQIDGSFSTSATTDSKGRIFLENIPVGTYKVTETNVPSNVVLCEIPQTIALEPGVTRTLTFFNYVKPSLTVQKISSVTKDSIKDAKFHIWYGSDHTNTGELNDLGTYYTDANGQIILTDVNKGWYKVVEEEPAKGYAIKDSGIQEFYLAGDNSKTITFENVPLSALVVYKYDSKTGLALQGAKFEVRYLADTSGTGGTVIGQYTTSENGSFTLTGLKAGTYIVQELESADGHVIDAEPQTVYISGKDQDVVTIRFGNAPKGALLIKKVDAATREPISDVEFLVTDSAGNYYGNANGKYVTDSAGTILIEDLIPGTTMIAKETRAKDGYALDDVPQTALIKSGETATLEFRNRPLGSLLVKKIDAATYKPLSDVEFMVTASDGTVIGNANGKYTTDADGTFLVSGLTPDTTVVVKETRAKPGYLLDNTPQTVKIKSNETVSLEFRNQTAGSLVIQKKDSLTGTPLEGVVFKVTTSTGEFVSDENGQLSSNGLYETDRDGLIQINGVVGALVVTEVKTIPGYSISEASRTQTVVVNPNDTQTLTFYNTPSTTLVIHKYIEGTNNEPLSGVAFKVTDGSGAAVGPDDGVYYTDKAGEIVLDDLEPGMTVIAREIKTVDGFVLDGTPQDIKIEAGKVQNLTFWNQKQGTLVIKKLDSVTKEPLAGVLFKLTYADGGFVDTESGKLSSNGLYTTDANGEIRITGVTGTIAATEEQTIEGYTIDEGTKTQTVVVRGDDTQTLTFYNDPIGGVEIMKTDASDATKRIPNTEFEIRKMDGGLVDTVTTDANGRVFLPLDVGSYAAVETKAGNGYRVDNTPHYFEVESGKTAILTVTNKAISGILIHKTDATTGAGICGVTFLLYDSGKNPIGQYASDDRGYVYIEDLEAGKYFLRELENEGYVENRQLKTVYVKSGETTEIEWENIPITGQIQITKTSEDYNSMNGWPAGTALPGVVFEIYDRANNLVDTVQTNKNGIAISRQLPLGRYTVKETKSAEFYGVNSTPIEAEIEFEGQIVRLAMTNKVLYTNVSIKKTGYVEVVPGQIIRYDFSNIANNSTSVLKSFYWRDTLPTFAALNRIVTGTWNVRGSYKIVYKTNLTGGAYRVLADNLSTQQNYVLDASPAALGLASNERVTEFMVAFGVVPANFRQVEAPHVYCTVSKWLTGGSQIVNQADAGGIYDGQWIMAASRWVTRVYKPAKPLPRTGY